MIASFSYRGIARLYFGLACLLGVFMLNTTLESARALGVDLLRSNWLFLLLLQGVLLLGAVGIIGLTFLGRWAKWEAALAAPAPGGVLLRVAGAALCVSVFPVMFFVWRFFAGYLLTMAAPTFWIAWWGSLVVALGLRLLFRQGWGVALAGGVLMVGLLGKVVSLSMAISDTPLSMGWSEASRFYYASLFFSEKVYGSFTSLSVMHPTRYFLQSLPFMIDGLPLWAHRAWQVFLWVALSIAAGASLVKRVSIKAPFVAALAGAWFFLYLFQGAVYYHLLVMVAVVLWLADVRRPWQTFGVVVLASLWAGSSRVNWFPVPAMLAAALYFIEQPVKAQQSWLRYIIPPAGWFAGGMVAALAAQGAYIFLSGNANNLEAFGSSFTSDLLWYRLWPSPTFPLGTAPGTLIVSAPLIWLLSLFLRGQVRNWHPIRMIGLGSILLVLLGGGMVVSVKIGGGGDLHNMDAYLMMLGVVAAMVFWQRAVPDSPSVPASPPWFAAALAVIVPVYFALQSFNPVPVLRSAYDEFVVREIRTYLKSAAAQGQDSLLITQRQLVTFGEVDIPLVPEYEVVTLMEMAMSRNEKYLGQFYHDLSEHRFAYIVVSPLFLGYKGAESPFGEENDVWVRYVARPLDCMYQPLDTFEDSQVQILVPRPGKPVCSLVP